MGLLAKAQLAKLLIGESIENNCLLQCSQSQLDRFHYEFKRVSKDTTIKEELLQSLSASHPKFGMCHGNHYLLYTTVETALTNRRMSQQDLEV